MSNVIGAKELLSAKNDFTAELLIMQICLQLGLMAKKWKQRLNSEVLAKLVSLLERRTWSTAVQTIIIDLLISNSMLNPFSYDAILPLSWHFYLAESVNLKVKLL